ncbi:arsenate respiratory reductase iron-sulfur subunit ArrB [Ferrimonas sp. SCSIO 43195]|uniref:arsenate respiratory reductase iron-sulfur subunit ArrB n=1 Tax=Ferrimonas sp. SCSIO 43195 TaxID=2822844 RepID=UPI0020756B7F|nr:arsenate respiratory reductase iron-sulfur subunit ArrB [Ferrimonas sp. SCSIO 43195]USD38845.1 4Fe-4S dicluster domain-containing protein [Ferrimonas sp. SCSIO 43195]
MKFGMVIDLQKCVGCGGCDLACKTENNTADGIQWSHHITRTEGTFPDVRYSYIPTLCNHCEDAACVKVCPKGAMYKADNGLTLQDNDKCIGCRRCERACPYGVISFNKQTPHHYWQDDHALVAGGTVSPKEVLMTSGAHRSPHENPERGDTYPVTRPRRTVEKCTGCDHRQAVGLQPACVDACPAGARVIGDLDDPNSDVSRLIKLHTPMQLKPEAGTKPRVYYIRSFNVHTV